MDPRLILLICCLLASFGSGKNIWVQSWEDVRFGVQDLFQAGMFTGLTFVFMGLFHFSTSHIVIGLLLAFVSFLLIRHQAFVTEIQYLNEMIPLQSKAVFMSKALEKNPNTIQHLLDQVIQNSYKEKVMMQSYA